uniref:WxxW domain-containing protein n=1 Tax=Poecilia formosa TaxID=48698 RepID=A0A087Y0V3_POEFO
WTQWFDRDDPSGTGDWETIVDLRRENPGKICRDPVDIEAVTLSGLDASQTGENIYLNDLENGFVCRNQDQPDWECSDYKVRLSCAPDSCENGANFNKKYYSTRYNRDDPSGSGDWEHLSALISENPGGDLCAEPVYIEAATFDGEIPAIRTGESFYSYSPTKGFVCRNSDQNTGTCRNYKVRFGCFCRIRM